MAAPMKMLNFVKRSRQYLVYLKKLASHGKSKTIMTISTLSPSIMITMSCDSKIKIEEPDASKLSREYLIKSSSITSAEQSMILLMQTTLALQQAEKEYKEALLAVVFLLEFKLKVLGDEKEEARVWDLILEGRNLVTNTKKTRDDLLMLHQCADRLVDTAAEVAYMTGADIVATSANDRLNKVRMLLRDAWLKTEEAESKVMEAELKTISVEGKYAEEHAEELEIERQKILEGQVAEEINSNLSEDVTSNVSGDDQSSEDTQSSKDTQSSEDTQKRKSKETEKSDNDDFLEMFDKWGAGKEDNTAKDI